VLNSAARSPCSTHSAEQRVSPLHTQMLLMTRGVEVMSLDFPDAKVLVVRPTPASHASLHVLHPLTHIIAVS
jgi:hypothetical protein